jgi:3-deoxy-manno-octulosonate cytidylyltransferase (CMP-KDO synthetase)
MDSPVKAWGIIPARFASSRFPGKPLAEILGRPMFVHVYERARRSPALADVVLATDSDRIAAAAERYAVPWVMTRVDHPSGTDRVLEAAQRLALPADAVVVNIQGDEPALHPEMLTTLVAPFGRPEVQVTTLVSPLAAEAAAHPDLVKVVCDGQGRALYFSRAPIPFPRDGHPGAYRRHIGLYAFRLPALERFVALGPGILEGIEKLEQLRLLENGIPIHVVETHHQSIGVDRPADLDAVIRRMQAESTLEDSRP